VRKVNLNTEKEVGKSNNKSMSKDRDPTQQNENEGLKSKCIQSLPVYFQNAQLEEVKNVTFKYRNLSL